MRYFALLLVLFVTRPVFGDPATISSDGIDSFATRLNGSGVLIGEAETGRSGKDMYDSASKGAAGTNPSGVYFRTNSGLDSQNSSNITEHGTLVAGIMVGQSGVATGAFLHSAAFGAGADDVDIALTLNRLATLGNRSVRAINLSFGRPLQIPVEEPIGAAYLTQFIDWSARAQKILYVAT